MKSLFGIVSCDVIDSTSLERETWIQLRKDINNQLFRDIGVVCPDSWGRVVRGDTIECCLEKCWLSFRVALMIKCWFMEWASLHHAAAGMREAGVRYSIGIGTMRVIDHEMDLMDGPAIYMAGRNLDRMAGGRSNSCFEMETNYDDVNALIDNSLTFVDRIVEQATARQVPILYSRLMGRTENEIASRQIISQGAVNQRAKSAGWPFIKYTLNLLEHINYDRYVE